MKKITVFTPTYNRAYILEQCYKSLCNQTIKDFLWLVIDDGSTDNTKELVEEWKKENKIEIQYVFKENGGVHTVYNKAYELCTTELIVALDSDDDFEPEAIQNIIDIWEKSDKDKYLGIIANQHYRNSQNIIGNDFPKELESISYYDYYYKYGLSGDKVLVVKTELVKNYRFPVFENEKLYPAGDLYLEKPGNYIITHNRIMNKEYIEDGYTKSGIKMHILNSNGFFESHKYRLGVLKNPKNIVKSGIHYVEIGKLAGRRNIIKNSPRKLITILLYPAGILWYMVLKNAKRKMGK